MIAPPSFEQAVVAMPEVIACHMVAGEVDYLLEIVAADLEHYQRFLIGKLLNIGSSRTCAARSRSRR